MGAARQVKPLGALAFARRDPALAALHAALSGAGFKLSRTVRIRYRPKGVSLALIWTKPGARHEVALQFARKGLPDFRAEDFRPCALAHSRVTSRSTIGLERFAPAAAECAP